MYFLPINYQPASASVAQNMMRQNSSLKELQKSLYDASMKSLYDASMKILNELNFSRRSVSDLSYLRAKTLAQITENSNQMQKLQSNSISTTELENVTLSLIRTFNDIVNQKMIKNIKSDFWRYYLS